MEKQKRKKKRKRGREEGKKAGKAAKTKKRYFAVSKAFGPIRIAEQAAPKNELVEKAKEGKLSV